MDELNEDKARQKPSRKEVDRAAAFRSFNQMLIDDPMTGYIYECSSAGAVSSSVRSLFVAIYDRYGPYFAGNVQEANVAIQNTAEALQRQLRYAGLARTEDDARSIAADVMMSAKQFMTHRTHTDRQKEYELLEQQRYRASHAHTGDAVSGSQDPTFQGFLENMNALGHANQYFEKKLASLFRAIDAAPHSTFMLQSAAQILPDAEFGFNKALGVAAYAVRHVFESHPALKANDRDCPALFATPYASGLGKVAKYIVTDEYLKNFQQDALRSLKQSGAISPLVAVVLLDAQNNIAREAAIEFARAEATGMLTHNKDEREEKLRAELGSKLKTLENLSNLLVSEGLLHTVDKAEVKKNEAGLVALTVDFFAQGTGRGIER